MGKLQKPEWLLFAEKLRAEVDSGRGRSDRNKAYEHAFNLHWRAVREMNYPGTEDDWAALLQRRDQPRRGRR